MAVLFRGSKRSMDLRMFMVPLEMSLEMFFS